MHGAYEKEEFFTVWKMWIAYSVSDRLVDKLYRSTTVAIVKSTACKVRLIVGQWTNRSGWLHTSIRSCAALNQTFMTNCNDRLSVSSCHDHSSISLPFLVDLYHRRENACLVASPHIELVSVHYLKLIDLSVRRHTQKHAAVGLLRYGNKSCIIHVQYKI